MSYASKFCLHCYALSENSLVHNTDVAILLDCTFGGHDLNMKFKLNNISYPNIIKCLVCYKGNTIINQLQSEVKCSFLSFVIYLVSHSLKFMPWSAVCFSQTDHWLDSYASVCLMSQSMQLNYLHWQMRPRWYWSCPCCLNNDLVKSCGG